MAPRYLNVILLLCSLVTMFCQGTREIYPRKLYCCVEYQQQPIPIQNIKGYKMQSSTEVCHIDAIIFYTIKNYKVCANIKDNWVKQALDHLRYTLFIFCLLTQLQCTPKSLRNTIKLNLKQNY
uniref:Chemokine interleukin-8-like domain-containing protein n=1 Tax=Esox lucius TaxID=8010 RepID=A0AAY5L5M0_ESOLU